MKLLVKRGKYLIRPALKIRDTAYCRNHWQERMPAKGGGFTYGGGESASRVSVAQAIANYFDYFNRANFEPVWVDEIPANVSTYWNGGDI